MNRTWGAEKGCGEARCCAGTGYCGGGPGTGLPKLSLPGAGTFQAWVGVILVLQITRITLKEKRDSSQIGVLGTPALAHWGAFWHLRAPPRGRKCPLSVGDPHLSSWELRALGGSDNPASRALGRPGKELGRQRPSAPRTRQGQPGSGLSTRSRWLGGQLLGSPISVSQPLTPTPVVGQQVTPC